PANDYLLINRWLLTLSFPPLCQLYSPCLDYLDDLFLGHAKLLGQHRRGCGNMQDILGQEFIMHIMLGRDIAISFDTKVSGQDGGIALLAKNIAEATEGPDVISSFFTRGIWGGLGW